MTTRIEHNPYVNRYHYRETELIRRKELQDAEKLKAERVHEQHLERIRDKDAQKGRYVDKMV